MVTYSKILDIKKIAIPILAGLVAKDSCWQMLKEYKILIGPSLYYKKILYLWKCSLFEKKSSTCEKSFYLWKSALLAKKVLYFSACVRVLYLWKGPLLTTYPLTLLKKIITCWTPAVQLTVWKDKEPQPNHQKEGSSDMASTPWNRSSLERRMNNNKNSMVLIFFLKNSLIKNIPYCLFAAICIQIVSSSTLILL